MITTDHYLSYDIDRKVILFQENIEKKIYPASITKLMTALILYENTQLDDIVKISYPPDYLFEGKVAYLDTGTELSVEQLIEFLLVFSANDIAYATAIFISDSVDEFVVLMNDKAKKLNMNNTNFVNPDGLDQPNHYTTLKDLLILSEYILENTKMIDITNKSKFYFDDNGVVKEFKNTNLLINNGFKGLKTGWTSNAGLTFVGYNQNNNRNILTIVNKSLVDENKESHFSDTVILYRESINNFKKNIVALESDKLYRIVSPYDTNYYYFEYDIIKFGNVNIKNEINLLQINMDGIQISDNYDNKILEINLPQPNKYIRYNFLKSNVISRLVPSN